MEGQIKQETVKLFDRLIADLEPLRQTALDAKNNRAWRWACAAIELAKAARRQVMGFEL